MATAHLGRSVMPRVVSVYVHPSVWSPTSPCVAATAPPTTASVSCTCGPAKNRWTSAWPARENAVSDRARVTGMFHPCVLTGWNKDTRCRTESMLTNHKRKKDVAVLKIHVAIGVNCTAIRKELLTSPLIPFQKCVSWRVNLPNYPSL